MNDCLVRTRADQVTLEGNRLGCAHEDGHFPCSRSDERLPSEQKITSYEKVALRRVLCQENPVHGNVPDAIKSEQLSHVDHEGTGTSNALRTGQTVA